MPTILLLTASNLFMTIAWYWHLKAGATKPLILVIAISWGIALFEYCLAVPANRLGYAAGWSAGQLKVKQEVITLVVFAIFASVALDEALTWRHAGAFCCLIGASRLSSPVGDHQRASASGIRRQPEARGRSWRLDGALTDGRKVFGTLRKLRPNQSRYRASC